MNIPNKKGFTLVELLVVIAIIGILASIVVISLSGEGDKANDAKIKISLSQLAAAQKFIKVSLVIIVLPTFSLMMLNRGS